MPTSPTPPSSNDPRFEMSAVAASDDDYDGGGGTEDEDRSLADSSVYEDDGGGAVILLDATMCRFVFSPAKGSKETRRVCGNQKDLCTRAVPYKAQRRFGSRSGPYRFVLRPAPYPQRLYHQGR
jgi:hypothetical protein